MEKRITHFIKKPFDNFSLCGIKIIGEFSSLNINNVDCKDCLNKLKLKGN